MNYISRTDPPALASLPAKLRLKQGLQCFMFLMLMAGFSGGFKVMAKKATPIKIAIVGDSTVADYAEDDPHRGWGQLFRQLVDPRIVTLTNFAVNGRSTRTFKSEGRWKSVLEFGPNYILIQFGHNDSHAKDRPEATDASTDYSEYLREYVDSAREHKAAPILVTPMHRGLWEKDGRTLTSELLPYVQAMRRIASEKKVTLIDLYELSGREFEGMGRDRLESIFANPDADHTHFNWMGAQLLARLVAVEMVRMVPALRPYIVSR